MAKYMNPYNFVRLLPMADDARQIPLGHKRLVKSHQDEAVYSGEMQCLLTAFSPFIILSHEPEDVEEDNTGHKKFKSFFHYPSDARPVIPGSSLKGAVRAIAEAASNSCFSVLNLEYPKRWDNFKDAYPPSLHFCGGVDTNGAFCPTCRIFGTAPEEETGTSERGAPPQAFQGKVRFHDAHFQGELVNIYDKFVTLIPLLDPKVSNKSWYYDESRGSIKHPLAGRKFYYHHDDLQPKKGAKKAFNSTVRPLKAGATFTFRVSFQNLLESELRLLLYALELEPAAELVQLEEDPISFNWQAISEHPGIYPKMGYGKPAGLGSVCVLVTALTHFDPEARYVDSGEAAQTPYKGEASRTFVEEKKQGFLKTHRQRADDGNETFRPYLADLQNILRFPNGILSFRYPRMPQEFKRYVRDKVKLPLPGQENSWKG